MKKKVLFLCTHNSCRSQIAEGIVNHNLNDRFQAFSAGIEATSVNSRAIEVMQEIGIDLSGHRSKTMDEFAEEKFDYVITLCGDANEKCPLFFGGVERKHIGFHDPSKVTGTNEEFMAEFRRTREEIKTALLDFFAGK
jgi:arsenate reductase